MRMITTGMQDGLAVAMVDGMGSPPARATAKDTYSLLAMNVARNGLGRERERRGAEDRKGNLVGRGAMKGEKERSACIMLRIDK